MGEWWGLEAGRRQLFYGKNFVRDEVALLFTDDELTIALAPDRLSDDAPFVEEIFRYQSDVRSIRARLTLQGFAPERVFAIATTYLGEVLDDPDQSLLNEKERALIPADTIQVLKDAIDWSWDPVRARPGGSDRDRQLESVWRDLVESFDDPRFAISLGLHGARANTTVKLDLSGCLMGGWLEPEERPHRSARARLNSRVASSGSIIVVTEGSTDASLISRALELSEPAVAYQFSFLDFESTSAAGGVDQVVKLTRSLAAAGVVNRVIAVLDNDAVGVAATLSLQQSKLPSNFAIRTLPDVELAKNYPTVGAQGATSVDVNGHAVTIEMMFGESVLHEGANGALPQVHWKGPIPPANRYQGEMEHKRQVQAAISKALKAANKSSDLEPAVAEGCRNLALLLLNAAAIDPMMTSEFSPLLRERLEDVEIHVAPA